MNLDVAMGDFRRTLELDHLVCFTAGWAWGVVSAYSIALRQFSEVNTDEDSTSETAVSTCRSYLQRGLTAVAAMLDELILPAHVESLASLSGLRCILMVYDNDRSLANSTARLMEIVSREALAALEVTTVFDSFFQNYGENLSHSANIENPALESAAKNRDDAVDANTRYQETHNLDDLNQAIRLARSAVEALPMGYIKSLSQEVLARSLFERYGNLGAVSDINQAVELLLDSINGLAPDDLLIPTNVANLGYVLTVRFERFRVREDIDMAIDALELTVDKSNGPAGRQVLWWANLANALRLRWYYCSHDIADLDLAIELYKVVLRVTPSSWSDYEAFKQNLANTEFNRAEAVNEEGPDAAARHVNALREVVTGLRKRPWDAPNAFANLGLALRHQSAYQPEAKIEAIKTLRRSIALSREGALPQTLDVAIRWGDLAFRDRSWKEAVEAYNYASTAIEELFRVQLGQAEKATALRSAQGLSANLAFALVKTGQLDEAVITIEAGIGRMLADVLEKNRSDLAALQTSGHVALFDAYQSVTAQIAALSALPRDRQGRAISGSQADELRSALDDIIGQIRRVPGFETFLSKMTLNEIRGAARYPIVYVFATATGGMALVVQPQATLPVQAIDLPAMTQSWIDERVARHVRDQHDFLRSQRNASQFQQWARSIDNLLDELWATIMRPLLEHLKTTQRLLLIPVGIVQLLPLHASSNSGLQNQQVRSVRGLTTSIIRWFGRRASSDCLWTASKESQIFYAPNAATLRSAGPLEVDETSALLVQNSKSAYGDLKWASFESDLIRSYFPRAHCLMDTAATPKAVLQRSMSASLIHFSCHGYANLLDPLESGLVLANDEELTVRDLTRLGRMRTSLALLLACETGVAGVLLPDEIVSLPTALQQTGTKAVIATLWSIGDLPSALFAGRFYEGWKKQGLSCPDAYLAAIRWLRECTWYDLQNFIDTSQCEVPEELDPPADRSEKPYAHPIFWAPFYWTGPIH